MENFVRSSFALLLLLVLSLPAAVVGDDKDTEADDNQSGMSLEQLLSTPVTTARRREETLGRVAGAVFVLRGEEIRRFGATNIPDALRLVPGVSVSRIGLSNWSVSVRGFGGRYSNKLLVMLDGRTVYSQLFGGVFWDLLETPLEDIDRIEVMRGPGAAIWGTNAVTGVIHIITKSALRTQSSFASLTSGNRERGLLRARTGGPAGRKGAWRLYGQHSMHRDVSSFFQRDHQQQEDARWTVSQVGFRGDWTPREEDRIEAHVAATQSDTWIALSEPILQEPLVREQLTKGIARNVAASILWERNHAHGGISQGMLAFDNIFRDGSDLNVSGNGLEISYHYSRRLSRRHEIGIITGTRRAWDRVGEGYFIFKRPDRAYGMEHAGVQYDFSVSPERLSLTLAARQEHNSFTGWTTQPTARLLYTPSRRHTLWGAWSKAMRTPSRGELDLGSHEIASIRFGPTILGVTSIGNSELDNETGSVWELGWRTNGARWSLDLSSWHSNYKDLFELSFQRLRSGQFRGQAATVAEVTFENSLRGQTWGGEAAVQAELRSNLRVSLALSNFNLHGESAQRISLVSESDTIGQVPAWRAHSRISWDLHPRWEVDATAFWRSTILNSSRTIKPQWRGDFRIGYKISEASSLSLAVQNALRGNHMREEAYNLGPAPAPLTPSVWLRFHTQF
jgi:iron complex outermembrane recepter protein